MVAAVDAVGALLVGALLVIPAAIARLFARSVLSLELLAGAVGLAEALAGLWISYELDVPPGAAIATLGGQLRLAACSPAAGVRIATARGRAVSGALLDVNGLEAGYVAGAQAVALEFTFRPGALPVLGPNGGGKTTLFRALLGEPPQRSGEFARRAIAYVPRPSAPASTFRPTPSRWC